MIHSCRFCGHNLGGIFVPEVPDREVREALQKSAISDIVNHIFASSARRGNTERFFDADSTTVVVYWGESDSYQLDSFVRGAAGEILPWSYESLDAAVAFHRPSASQPMDAQSNLIVMTTDEVMPRKQRCGYKAGIATPNMEEFVQYATSQL